MPAAVTAPLSSEVDADDAEEAEEAEEGSGEGPSLLPESTFSGEFEERPVEVDEVETELDILVRFPGLLSRNNTAKGKKKEFDYFYAVIENVGQ